MRLSESGLCIEDRWSITYPQLGQFHPTNLFLSLNLWCKDLARQKKRKSIWSEYIECFGPWTVFMRWSESGLCTRDGWLRADQFHPTNLFLSLNLWCKDLARQKKRKSIWSEYIECFGPWTVFMRWSESGLCTRDGWLRADQFHPTNLFLSLNLWCKDLVP